MKIVSQILFGCVLVVGFFTVSIASTAKNKTQNSGLADHKRIDKIVSLFSGAKTVKLSVEKSVISEILQKTTVTQADIYIGQGKLRWEVLSPEKSLVVFDGQTLWTEQPANEIQPLPSVTKSKMNKNQKDQDLIKLLTGEQWSHYLEVKNRTKVDDVETVYFTPKKTSSDIKEFSFVVTKNKLSDIRYTDEVGNQTTLKIQKIEVLKKADSQIFKYKIPPHAQVNEL